MEEYLRPTPAIDCDHPLIQAKAQALTAGKPTVPEQAKAIFYFMREEIPYNFYTPGQTVEDFKASTVLARGNGFCVPKGCLLAALARAVGIPARLHFAMIRNHMASEKVIQLLGSNIFATHCYNDLYIEGQWVKMVSSFDGPMCRERGLPLVEFDGRHDALFPAYTADRRRYIEYLKDRGSFADLPLEDILRWRSEYYGPEYNARLNEARLKHQQRGKIEGI